MKANCSIGNFIQNQAVYASGRNSQNGHYTYRDMLMYVARGKPHDMTLKRRKPAKEIKLKRYALRMNGRNAK